MSTDSMRSNETLIGRDDVDDIDAILAISNTDVDEVVHAVQSNSDAIFTWDYERTRTALAKLYEKAKTSQWNANDLPWETPVNQLDVVEANRVQNRMIFENYDLTGTPVEGWGEDEWTLHAIESQNWTLSQFMHGEQGALICAAKIVQTVPDIDSKFYAATQVVDEARHVEVYSRYLHEKLQLAYPINPHLKALLDDALTDQRWDMTYLAMQVLIEGLALAAFGLIRNQATDPLGKALNAYVMQDEARHVTFGRLALRDYYPQLTDAERDDREQFCVDACYLMRDRFLGEEVWDNLGLPTKEVVAYVDSSEILRMFRGFLFSRIVPTLRDIGLWGPRIRDAFTEMGVLGFAETDIAMMITDDEQQAERLDAERKAAIDATAALGADG
jgi:hypothetical protein